MGLFSLIDTLTGRPMDQALVDLPLSSATHEALLGRPNPVRRLLDLIQAFERADWEGAGDLIETLGLDRDMVPSIYFDAVEWGNRTTYIR